MNIIVYHTRVVELDKVQCLEFTNLDKIHFLKESLYIPKKIKRIGLLGIPCPNSLKRFVITDLYNICNKYRKNEDPRLAKLFEWHIRNEFVNYRKNFIIHLNHEAPSQHWRFELVVVKRGFQFSPTMVNFLKEAAYLIISDDILNYIIYDNDCFNIRINKDEPCEWQESIL